MALIDVERAVMDMRRGIPVVIEDAPGAVRASAVLVVAAELADAQTLDFLENMAGAWPHLHLTHRRAETLKIRLYTEGGVSVAVPREEALTTIAHLCDPARDLEFVLQGPFRANETPLLGSQIASLQLAKLAGLLPATLSAPLSTTMVLNGAEGKTANDTIKDGARAWAHRSNLLHVEAEAITSCEDRMAADLAVAGELAARLKPVTDAKVPLEGAPDSHIYAFRPFGPGGGGPEHLAIVIGTPDTTSPVLVRLHSECFTGDLLSSLKCDCGQQLRGAIEEISKAGSGILLYLAQEGRGIGLMNKLRAYQLQDRGFDTVEANLRLGFEVDERVFGVAAQMLRQLGVARVRLMTNNPDKQTQLIKHGLAVTERVPHAFTSNEHNARYLATKAEKTGHLL